MWSKSYLGIMNEMTVGLYQHQDPDRQKVLAWILKSGVTSNNIRQINSWNHATTMAEEFGIDPELIAWSPEALEWCTEQWGEPPA